MSLTRRDALAAALGGGLLTATAGADEKPAAAERPWADPVIAHVPLVIRPVFESTFPGHRCVRMAVRKGKPAPTYRGTFFNPTDPTVHTKRDDDGDLVTQPILYHLEVASDLTIVEETPHPLHLKLVPAGVMAAYQKWDPHQIKAMARMWYTGVPRGKDRVYYVNILVNQIKAYGATFKEDGTVIKADPIPAV